MNIALIASLCREVLAELAKLHRRLDMAEIPKVPIAPAPAPVASPAQVSAPVSTPSSPENSAVGGAPASLVTQAIAFLQSQGFTVGGAAPLPAPVQAPTVAAAATPTAPPVPSPGQS